MADQRTFGAKQVATRIGTDAKQLRKFLRDPKSGYDAVGQGGRYDFPEEEIVKIKTAFDAWSSTKTTRNRSSQENPTDKPAIPGQRTTSPTPRKQRVDPKLGLHGNGLDDDDLRTRMTGIAARVHKHGLTTKNGKFVPLPNLPEQAKEHPPVEAIYNPYPPIESIPGLVAALEVPDDVEDLDIEGYGGPNNELQELNDYLERSLDDGTGEEVDLEELDFDEEL